MGRAGAEGCGPELVAPRGVSTLLLVAAVGLACGGVAAPQWQREDFANGKASYSTRVLTVTTILVEPYAMLRPRNETTTGVTGNSLYHGYIVDLLDHVADIVGFRYRLVPAWDGKFGYRQQDDSWNGMIGEVTRKEADIAAGPLFITRQRQQVVDFTSPFMSVGGAILLKKVKDAREEAVTSVEDLLHDGVHVGTLNRGIMHRALKITNNTLYRILYDSMIQDMDASFTKSNEEGIEQARRGGYAFILPDKIADYISRRGKCDLRVIGNFLLSESFALAVPKGSALLAYLSRSLDMLREQGLLDSLYRKWWIEKGVCGEFEPRGPGNIVRRVSSDEESSPNTAPRLHLHIAVGLSLGVALTLACCKVMQT